MNIRHYVLILSLGTLASLTAWAIVLYMLDPATAGLPGFFAFYITLFCSVLGLAAIIGTVIRLARVKSHEESVFLRVIVRSFRQGIVLACLVIGALLLVNARIFSSLTFFFIIVGAGILEFLFLFWEEQQVRRVS